MRAVSLFAAGAALALVTCRERGPVVVQLGAPTPYVAAAESGRAAPLRVDGALAGHADAAFGVRRVGGDGLVYRRVATWRPSPYAAPRTDVALVLRTSDGTTLLAAALPHFEDGFARPVFQGDTVHYWGLRRVGLHVGTLYAMRAVLPTGAVDSVHLGSGIAMPLTAAPAQPPNVGPAGVRYEFDARRRALVQADYRGWRRAE